MVARNYAALLHRRCDVLALTCAECVCMIAGGLKCHCNAILVRMSHLITQKINTDFLLPIIYLLFARVMGPRCCLVQVNKLYGHFSLSYFSELFLYKRIG